MILFANNNSMFGIGEAILRINPYFEYRNDVILEVISCLLVKVVLKQPGIDYFSLRAHFFMELKETCQSFFHGILSDNNNSYDDETYASNLVAAAHVVTTFSSEAIYDLFTNLDDHFVQLHMMFHCICWFLNPCNEGRMFFFTNESTVHLEDELPRTRQMMEEAVLSKIHEHAQGRGDSSQRRCEFYKLLLQIMTRTSATQNDNNDFATADSAYARNGSPRAFNDLYDD